MIDYISTKSLAMNAKHYTYFFTPDTMRFFNSRLAETAYIVDDADGIQYAYFVTSERYNTQSPRYYSVRRMAMIPGARSWKHDTLGEFQQYKTGKAAHKAMVKAVEAHNVATGSKDPEQFRKTHLALRDANRQSA